MTRKITNGLRELLTGWKKSKFISGATYRRIYCSGGTEEFLVAIQFILDSTYFNFDNQSYSHMVSAVPITSVNTILKHFNSYHRRLQFTIEIGNKKFAPTFHQKNLEFIVNILLKNDYPISFIFDTISERLYINFFSLNNLNKIIRMHKDSLLDSSKRNVYRINCNDCDASYVGQTGKKLKTRISEHFNHIKRNTSHSAITEHRTHYNHEFR
ncbi:hypothetical protein ALC60_04785 [Trachymyrmex zeteki]|uniref:GIY-YIG domain-containing protein n=1 Tax=Mycetomoellerius zeteki TaxID=64791 RepID=A0A151X7M8_9HYME|nr:hypothetical protein ALC60_04785 [Trachymyrmex zeteki]